MLTFYRLLAVMKMISIRKQQREELKKSRASSTAQSLPTIDENVDKRSNIRLSERPSSDSLSSFTSLGSSEGTFNIFQYFITSLEIIIFANQMIFKSIHLRGFMNCRRYVFGNRGGYEIDARNRVAR